MVKSKNERKTEHIVREDMRKLGYYKTGAPTHVEEQKSSIAAVIRLLRSASKSGKGGAGAPEFIVSSDSNPDLLLIVECKADPKDHSSKMIPSILAGTFSGETEDACAKRVQRYAVDGALHYAKALSKEFNVIAIGVSGETKTMLQVKTFLYPKGGNAPKLLTTKLGTEIGRVLPWADYLEHATFDPAIQQLRMDELMAFARELHDFMRDHAKLTESDKPLMVGGTLLALRNKAFVASYDKHPAADLQQEWLDVIRKEIEKAEIPKAKKNLMVQPYSTIAVHPELGKATKVYPKGILNELIRRLNEKVWPFISIYHDFDVVGQFYGEFLKYSGGDKKALGIVLTPRHITELFARIANVNKKSKVLDICAGTGGFLISAMTQMMRGAQTEAERAAIKKNGLIGVEQQPNMYALAASNMILRGDGKANLYQGSCFDARIEAEVKKHRCGVGLINPPFSQDADELHELVFVKKMLDCLTPGGTGVAIVPMSRAIAPHVARGELLRAHTLEAVMSMPGDLFYPVGTVTCIMVFTAHIPHMESNRKSWFGYWKDDGFIKTKHRGRVDVDKKWPAIMERWVEMFRNREVHPGESVARKVTEKDEWCAEAYMETDYAKLTRTDFQRAVKNHSIFRLLSQPAQESTPDGKRRKIATVRVEDLFEVRYGVNLELNALKRDPLGINFVSRTAKNNGVSAKVAKIDGVEPLPAGTITVAGGGSVMESFLQPEPYYSGRDLYYLAPKVPMTDAQKLYYCTVLRANRYRYNYGRQANRTLKEIPIPALKNIPSWVSVEKPDQIDGKI